MKKKIITLIALFFILAMINQSNQNQNIIVNQSEPKAAISTYWDYDNKINKIDNESLYIDKPNAIMITQSRSNPYFTYDFSYTVYLQRDNGTFLLPSDYSPFAWGPIDIGAGVLRYNTFNTYRTNFTSSYNNKLLYIKSTFVHANGTMEGLTYTILPKSQQTSDLVFPIGCGPTPYCQYSFYSSPTSYNRMYIYDTPAYIYPNHLDLTTHFTIPVLMVSAISTVGKTYIPDFEYQAEIWNSTHSLYGLAGNFSVVPPSPMELAMDMIYNLEPNIVLNSTYYNKMNTRIEVYDEIEAKWIETTYSDIVIRSYRYKLRILDLENNILYEDLNYVNYATTRTITIESFKLQNNAGEMINIDVYGDHGFYQGDQTFDGIDQNTQPSIIEDQSFSYVQNQYQDHNKVLYLNGTATLRPTTTQGNVEFWLNSNESVICNGEIIGSTGNTWTHISRTFSSTPIEITGTSYLDAIDYSSATNYTLNRSQKLNATVEIINYLQNQPTYDYNRTGWYQGAYSFDNETINTIPTGWTNDNTIMATVKASQNIHSKILNFSQTTAQYGQTVYSFSSKTTGTVEFWVNLGQINCLFWIALRDTNSQAASAIQIYNGLISIYNSTSYINAISFTANTWYHFRITFDCETDLYNVWINNQLKAENYLFYAPRDDIAKISISNRQTINNNSICLDAVDMNWSAGYFINRNTLLNYSTALNPILEAQNYNHTMHYQGAESFNNEIVNLQPTAFVNSYTTTVIYNQIATHRKVANITYTAPNGVSKYSFTAFSTGSVEFWFYLTSITEDRFLFLDDSSSTPVCGIRALNDKLYVFLYDGSYNYTDATSFTVNTWYHLRIYRDSSTSAIYYLNNVLWASRTGGTRTNNIEKFHVGFLANYATVTIDALDWSTSPGYFVNRNCLENQSVALESWNAYPNWVEGYRQSAVEKNAYLNYLSGQYTLTDTEIFGIKNMKLIETGSTTGNNVDYNIPTLTPSSTTRLETYWYLNKTNTVQSLYITNSTISGPVLWFWGGGTPSTLYARENSTSQIALGAYTGPILLHLEFEFVNVTHYRLFLNGTDKGYFWNYNHASLTTISKVRMYFHDTFSTNLMVGSGIIDYSSASGYYRNRILLDNTTASMLAINYTAAPLIQPTIESYLKSYNPYPIAFSKSVYPYSYTLFNYTASNNIYRIYDIYNNTLQWDAIKPTDTSIVYNPANIRECFISIHDQQANYLEWEQFMIRINGTLIYENRFYREIGTTWIISIYNQYGLYLTSTTHTVTRDDNYIAMQLIKRSLKIYNQQETFLHVNITYDPNYYNFPYFWSNWLAPKEVKEYYLIEDYYRVSISNFENGSAVQHFSYNLINDDLLLISSSNTLYNVLANINNVNTSINNQFTYVALNFTNTNSQIGNQTILLEINFENQNTTLGQMLLSQQNSFNYYNSSFNTLFINQANNFSMFQTNLSNIYLLANNNFQTMNTSLGLISIMNQNSFSALNTSIDELILMGANSFVFTNGSLNQIIAQNQNSFSFINSSVDEIKTMNQNTFSFLNTSVSNLYALSENSFVFMNSSVAALTTQSLNSFEFLNSSVSSIYALSILSFEALNSSFDNLNLNMFQNFSFTNSLINQNQLQLMTQFSFIDSNITELSIDIDSRLITLNSTISNLTAQLSNYIVLVNNSIYTAVLESAAALTLQGNEILGNLSMTFVQNDYLTKILQETMFSSLLNWTNVNYNYSIIESQIDKFQFINKNNNDTYQLFLKYQNQIEELTIAAQNFRELQLPASDVEYRVKSVNTGEYLDDWQPLTNQTVELGTYTAPLQIEDIKSETNDWLMLVAFMFAIIVVSMYLVWDSKKKITKKTTHLPEGPNTFFKI